MTLGIDNAHLTQRKRRFRKGRTDNYMKRGRYDKANKTDQNPVDQDGNILRCFRCDSTRHLTSKSPDKSSQHFDKTSYYHEEHITLFATAPDVWQYCLIEETFGLGVLG